MRSVLSLLIGAGLLIGGCDRAYRTHEIDDELPAGNAWMVRTLQDESIENAIIAQRTIYPYHFVRDSAQLTPVGARDVRVLAAHFQKYPGALNVRRGEENGDLYQRRLDTLADALAAAGVDPAAIRVGDGLPGGDGLESERAIAILKLSNTPGARGGGGDTGADDAQGASSMQKGANR